MRTHRLTHAQRATGIARVTRWTSCFALLAMGFVNGDLHAELDARDLKVIEIGSYPTLAPRGGVLLARLASRNDTSGWPTTLTVELDDGEGRIELIGHVGWVEPLTLPGNPTWSSNRTGNVMRPTTAADDTAALPQGEPGSGPYLLLELPSDGSGDLLVGRQRIPLYWTELPPDLPFQQPGRDVTPAGTMVMENAPNRPHADNAFSWWRWTLLANRLNMNPPPAPNASTVQRLLSHHIAQVWRIGLHRLATQSLDIASQCRDLLTFTCHDEQDEFAAWVSDAVSINELLNILLDPSDQDTITERALAWADRQVPMVAWIEQAYGSEIVLAIGNPYPTSQLAQILWRNQGSVPIGVALDPGLVTRVKLPRPPESLITTFYPEIDARELLHLNLVVRDHVMTLAFGPEMIPAEPPGPLLGPFRPPMTMTAARTQIPLVEPESRSTWCQIRRLSNRWELFIECQRPQTGTDSHRLSSFMRSLDQLRGIEAVTVLVGPPRHERAPASFGICIPEQGDPRIIIGPSDDAPEIHIRSYEDRWLARFVMPSHWLPGGANPLLLSLIRTHGDSRSFETSPNTSVPWSMHVDPVHLDISAWSRSDFQLPVPRRRE